MDWRWAISGNFSEAGGEGVGAVWQEQVQVQARSGTNDADADQ